MKLWREQGGALKEGATPTLGLEVEEGEEEEEWRVEELQWSPATSSTLLATRYSSGEVRPPHLLLHLNLHLN